MTSYNNTAFLPKYGLAQAAFAGGKRLHLLVAIAYGKGVICAEPYVKMSGSYFSRFKRHFPVPFNITGKENTDRKKIVMDYDPSQTSALARRALRSIDAEMERMEAEVKEKNIFRQTWEEFVNRVKLNIWSISQEYVDKTIRLGCMPNRVKAVAKFKGRQTKY